MLNNKILVEFHRAYVNIQVTQTTFVGRHCTALERHAIEPTAVEMCIVSMTNIRLNTGWVYDA